MHRGDDRRGDLLPHECSLLAGVGDLAASAGDRGRTLVAAVARHGLEHPEVEARAERPPLPRQHDRSDRGIGLQRLAGLDERAEQRAVERVHLVRAVHPHVGHAVLDGAQDAIRHDASLPLPGAGGMLR